MYTQLHTKQNSVSSVHILITTKDMLILNTQHICTVMSVNYWATFFHIIK